MSHRKDEPEETVAAFIKHALAERDRKRGTQSDLKAIAAEVGLDERDLAKVERAAQEHLERGTGYSRHGRFDEAIAELSVTAALRPGDVTALHRLAEAHAGRWRSARKADDRAEAERLAKQCVDLKPGFEPAFALLESLDKKPEARLPGTRPASWRSAFVLAGVIFGGLGLVAAISHATRKGTTAAPAAVTSPPATGRPVDLELAAAAPFAGMTVQLDRSREVTKDHVYCAEGDVTPPPGAPPPSSVPMKLEMLDGSGSVLARDLFTAWPCTKHPGSFHFHRDNPLDARLARAVLSVQPIGGR